MALKNVQDLVTEGRKASQTIGVLAEELKPSSLGLMMASLELNRQLTAARQARSPSIGCQMIVSGVAAARRFLRGCLAPTPGLYRDEHKPALERMRGLVDRLIELEAAARIGGESNGDANRRES